MGASDDQPLQPRGRTQYDLKSLPKSEFEQLCFRLIRLDFPQAVKPHDVRDGGADALLPKKGGGYARAWQSKHFPGAISWEECKKSFESAKKNFAMEHYTFCFPRNLTDTERKTFDKHFRQADNPIEVDYWNGEELQIRLAESPEGERVAKGFFADPRADMKAIERVVEAGGPLDTTDDALDRLAPIGKFLASEDPFFSYSAVVHEADQPAPTPPDEAIMSVAQTDEGLTERLDVVPRDDEAVELFGPEGRLLFPNDERGQKAFEEISQAIDQGRGAQVEGVTVTFDRLPPGMKSVEGKPMTGRVEIKPSAPDRPPPPAPWRAQMIAKTDQGTDEINVDLLPMAEPPPDWDAALEGGFGGMRIRMLFRRTEKAGEMTLNYVHRLDSSPIRQQLRALRFLDTLTGDGQLIVKDRDRGRDDLVLETERQASSEEQRALFALLENLAAIEKWSGEQLGIPDEVSAEEAHGVAVVAAMIRGKGMPVRFTSAELSVRDEGLALVRDGGELAIAQDLGANVLGQEVPLGRAWMKLRGYKIIVGGPDPKNPGSTLVRVEPDSDEAGRLFQSLAKPGAAKTRRRPPPPPRRGKRKNSTQRRRRKGKKRRK